ncbi:uncharacterized, partial [Tachysurus ichikawai]
SSLCLIGCDVCRVLTLLKPNEMTENKTDFNSRAFALFTSAGTETLVIT